MGTRRGPRSKRRAGQRVLAGARQARVQHLIANWWFYLPFVLIGLTITFVARWFMQPGELRGLFTGTTLTLFGCVGFFMVTTLSGAQTRASGGEAERFTTQALRRLDPSRWAVFDHVEFADFDIDHVVIGPGVVYAVETKWRTSVPEQRYLGDFCPQSRRAADRLGLLLKSKGLKRDVRPVVVLWGPDHREVIPAEGKEVDGVLVLGGGHAVSWRPQLERNATGLARDYPAIHAIEEYIVRHDTYLAAGDGRSRRALRGTWTRAG